MAKALELLKTHNSECRQQKRCISDFALGLVSDYGAAERAPGNTVRRSFDKRALKQLECTVGRRLYRDILREVPKLTDIYLIIAPSGLVITTGYRR